MTKINLRAGDIQTDIRCEDSDPENLANIARDLQEWQMKQWTQVDGACVSTVPSINFR